MQTRPRPLPRTIAVATGLLLWLMAIVAASGSYLNTRSSGGTGLSGASTPVTSYSLSIAVLDLAAVAILVSCGAEVRLVLILGALPLFVASGDIERMLAKMVIEMANPATVVPIGAAVGFAFVLRMTGCDRHSVELLMIPLRRVRFLLVPGGVAAGYLINTTIVSQAGTASVLGPILLPLLRASGLEAGQAGAVLLLGASMGGELFNPGAVEMRKLAELTGLPGTELVRRSVGLNLAACGAALGSFWLLSLRWGSRASMTRDDAARPDVAAPTRPRISLFKAMVPILPLAILTVDPLLGSSAPLHGLDGPPRILAALLIGVAAAGLASPSSVRGLVPAFFEGAGYAYQHIISLIVAASTFAEGVRVSGLIAVLVRAIARWPGLALAAATLAPWGLAIVSGTGIAPAVAVMEFFVPAAGSLRLDPVRLGTVASLGSHFGRTMSPVAAVVMVCSTLSHARPAELVRLVAPPLGIGGAVLITSAILRLL